LGASALQLNTTGSNNSALGFKTLFSNTTGVNNSGLGFQSLYSNTTGSNNGALGFKALYSNTTGAGNTASGNSSLYTNTTGGSNTASGYLALYSNTTGDGNTALGYGAGYTNSTGSKNVFIGYQAGYSETGSNKLYIDNSSTSSPLIKGDFAANTVTVNGALTVTGGITSSAVYHTNGTRMLSFQDGNVHVGDNSMVFTDSAVSASGADVMKSTVGKIQIGNSSSDTTTVKGSLTVEDPTSYYHAAHKGYVDALRTDMQKYDEQSVALSAALTSLPTAGGDGTHACGVGTGHRGQATAIAMGCAANLGNLSLPETAPGFIRDASLNVGTSFLTGSDRDFTFKAGLSWQFGGSRSTGRAAAEYQAPDNRFAQAERQHQDQKQNATIRKLQAELDALKREKDQELLALKRENDQELRALKRENDQELLALKAQVSYIATLLSRTNITMARAM
jgi:hypothetical protein